MEQIIIKKTKDILYYDTLDNGLQIFMIPKKKVNTVFASLNVKYGAMHNEFKPIGKDKMKKFPNGIAHFLEHKMFEQENGIDPMLYYAQNGADVNAYTSQYNTAYYFLSSDHLKENLEYLLDFVQSPFFTDENVEKEKGIIEEEIKMYDDDPYSYLDDKIRYNGFKKNPIRYSVAGEIKDIRAITKEDLYECYKTFYHPSNMFLVLTGNFDPNEIIKIVSQNQEKKHFDKLDKIVIKKTKEPDEVNKEYEEKEMNVEVPKISYGIKIPLKNISYEPRKRDIYLSIIFNSLFGSTSRFHEKAKENGLLLSYASISTSYTDSHLYITISADTEKAEELVELIKETLNDFEIDDDDFENKKKLFLSNYLYTLEDVDALNARIVNDLIIYGKHETDYDIILEGITKQELGQFIKQLNFDNVSIAVIKPFKQGRNI
ncbi:MAG TPA: insulinase family protein [Mollicutes bacterium]|nr:insulinase family protein [Mollicutes bacterium]